MKSLLSLGLVAALVVPPPVLAGETFRQDVSGADGKDDPDGYPDWTGSQALSRMPGMPGGHAQEVYEGGRLAKQGWAGGHLRLFLSVKGDKKLLIKGDRYEPENNRPSIVSGSIPLEADSSLQFIARGGAGGEGGNGGGGQMGGNGTDGRDAKRPSTEATDGTDGAPGGPGGHATNGGNAGPGGSIVLQTSIRDTDAFMLVDETDVSGANGGRAGIPGAGGAGGYGGSGGAGDEWRTQTGPWEVVGQDADGKDIKERGWEEFSLDPGDDGNPGPPGPDSMRPVYDGEDSADGEVHFDVEDEHGTVRRYESVYELELLPGFTLEGSHNGKYTGKSTDFFEPGETITISNLRVKNIGGMPTPKYQALKLFIGDNELYVRSNHEELSIDRELARNEEYSFGDKKITFHLAEKNRDNAGALKVIDKVSPGAYVDRVGRQFPNFSDRATREILVQYPIRITALQSMRSLKAGESQRVRFLVENISNQRIGRTELDQSLRYARTEFVRHGGKTNQDHVVFSPALDDGAVDPKVGIARDIDSSFLEPGGKMLVETFVGLSPNAKPWSDVKIRPYLILESILEKPLQKIIQFEDFFIRVGEEYVYTPDSDVLFIANHALNAEVLTAIKALAAVKHLKMDIWDFSRTGFFDFSHDIKDYGTIFEAYQGKTIMIMGNAINTPGGNVHAHRLINPDEVIEAARRYGIKVVVWDASNDREQTVAQLTEPLPKRLPIADPSQVREFASRKKYEREIEANVNEVQENKGDETSFLGTWQINHSRTYAWPWSEPKIDHLYSVGLKSLKSTEKFNPESQTYADLNYNPEYLGRRLGMFPKYTLGSVNLRRSVDDSKTSVVAINVPSRQLENPRYFIEPEFSTAFDFGLNFGTKLKLLNEIMLGEYEKEMGSEKLPEGFERMRALEPMKYARILVHSLLLDLLNEQERIRPLANRTWIPKKRLWDKLDLLKKLTHDNYDQYNLDPSTESGRIFVEFIVKMRFYNRAITSWADRWGGFWPFRSDRVDAVIWPLIKERNVEVSKVTAEMLDLFVGKIFGDAPAARKQIEAELKQFRQQASQDGVGRDKIMDYLDHQHLREAAIRDGQVNRAFTDRIRDESRQKSLLTMQANRVRRGADIKAAVDLETETLLLKQGECDRLLAQLPAKSGRDHVEEGKAEQDEETTAIVFKSPTGIPRVPVGR